MAARDATTATILRELRLVMERLQRNEDIDVAMRRQLVSNILINYNTIDMFVKGVPIKMAYSFALGKGLGADEDE